MHSKEIIIANQRENKTTCCWGGDKGEGEGCEWGWQTIRQ